MARPARPRGTRGSARPGRRRPGRGGHRLALGCTVRVPSARTPSLTTARWWKSTSSGSSGPRPDRCSSRSVRRSTTVRRPRSRSRATSPRSARAGRRCGTAAPTGCVRPSGRRVATQVAEVEGTLEGDEARVGVHRAHLGRSPGGPARVREVRVGSDGRQWRAIRRTGPTACPGAATPHFPPAADGAQRPPTAEQESRPP